MICFLISVLCFCFFPIDKNTEREFHPDERTRFARDPNRKSVIRPVKLRQSLPRVLQQKPLLLVGLGIQLPAVPVVVDLDDESILEAT